MSLFILDQTMTVYARSGSTTRYDQVVTTGQACRLNVTARRPGETTTERREMASLRILLWPADFILSEDAQIAVDGVVGADGVTLARWNVSRGTPELLRGPLQDPLYWRAQVVRATSV